MRSTARMMVGLLAVLALACGGGVEPAGDASDLPDGTRFDGSVELDGGPLDAAPPDGGEPPECVEDRHCDDGVSCTADRCVAEACTHAVDPSRCSSGATCDPVRDCVASTICATSADCADDDPCTQRERCDPATRTCQSSRLDGDDDGDPPIVCGGGDCDDGNRFVSSLAAERCNGVDNDCDGVSDEGTDLELCGSAELRCGDAYCECVSPAEMQCGLTGDDTCVDPRSDPRHCGGCFIDCGDAPCVDGACVCPAGQTHCEPYGCVDLARDGANCGRCYQRCLGSTTCSAGTCVACGGAGQPCCTGGTCGSSLSCISGTCGVPDRGTCDDPIPRLTAAEVPRCAASTYTCIFGCTTGACVQSCLAADPTPASPGGLTCLGCYHYTNNWCTDSGGCHAQWANYACCGEARCPTFERSCIEAMCGAELAAVNTCSNALPDTCFYVDEGEPRRCFP